MTNMLNNQYLAAFGGNLSNMQGGQLGQYWQPGATAQGNTSFDPYLANLGAQAAFPNAVSISQQLAQQGALHLAQQQANYLAQQSFSKPSLKIEIVAGEILGHRVWRVEHGFLKAAAMNTIWPPDEPCYGAVSYRGMDMQAGVHAFKHQQDALCQYGTPYNGVNDVRVVGTVLLWGDVVEHEDGYRAEWARVRSLDYIVGLKWHWQAKRTLRILRDRYIKPTAQLQEDCDAERATKVD